MAFGFDDFLPVFDAGGGAGGAGGGGIGDLLQSLLGLTSGAGAAVGSTLGTLGAGLGDAAAGFGSSLGQNPFGALQALGSLSGLFQSFLTPPNAQPPAQFPQGPTLAGPYPRRGIPRADFQSQGLSGASPDFYDQMTNPAYQNPYAYSFQPKAEDPRQVYA